MITDKISLITSYSSDIRITLISVGVDISLQISLISSVVFLTAPQSPQTQTSGQNHPRPEIKK